MAWFKGFGGGDKRTAEEARAREAAQIADEKGNISRAIVVWKRWCMKNARSDVFPKLAEFEAAASAATTLAEVARARSDFNEFVEREGLK